MSDPNLPAEEVQPATLDEMVEKADRSRRWDKRVKWGLFWGLMIGGLIGFFMLGQAVADRDTAQAEAASEQQQKKDIAVEAQAALCLSGEVAVYDADLCEQLEKVAAEPSRMEQGPQGVQGVQGTQGPRGLNGADGKDGQPGPIGPIGPTGPLGPVGPTGADGTDGINGTSGFDGSQGAAGAAGAKGDAGPPGSAGPPGANGSDGVPGAPGANGRGITSVTCEGVGDTSYWLVTYDDGTTQTSGGPCRIEAAAAPVPDPTESP